MSAVGSPDHKPPKDMPTVGGKQDIKPHTAASETTAKTAALKPQTIDSAAAASYTTTHTFCNTTPSGAPLPQVESLYEKLRGAIDKKTISEALTLIEKASVKELSTFFYETVDNEIVTGTILDYASRKGVAPVVEALIKKGVGVPITDIPGDSAIILAICEGHLPVVELLLPHVDRNLLQSIRTIANGYLQEYTASTKSDYALAYPGVYEKLAASLQKIIAAISAAQTKV